MTEPTPPAVVSTAASDSATQSPVTLTEILTEIRDETLQWDHGLPGTFRRLWLTPASVIRAYLWQRSNQYSKPLRYVLISVALGLLVNWFIHDKLGYSSILRSNESDVDQFIRDNAAVLTLLLLPLMAVVMRLLFHGLQIRYVDALVTLTYTQGQVNFASALLTPAVVFLPGSRYVVAAISLFLIVYLLWAWSSVAIGAAWRRWLAALLTLALSQALNGSMLWLLGRFG